MVEAVRNYASLKETIYGHAIEGDKLLAEIKSFIAEEMNMGLDPSRPDHKAHIHSALDCLDIAQRYDSRRQLETFLNGTANQENVRQEWFDYLASLVQFGTSYDARLAVLSLGHEMVVPEIRELMEKHFPDDERLGHVIDGSVIKTGKGFKFFNFMHGHLDNGEDGHAKTMHKIAEEWIKDPDIALQAATLYLQNRYALFAKVLGVEADYNLQPIEYPERSVVERAASVACTEIHGVDIAAVFAARSGKETAK